MLTFPVPNHFHPRLACLVTEIVNIYIDWKLHFVYLRVRMTKSVSECNDG